MRPDVALRDDSFDSFNEFITEPIGRIFNQASASRLLVYTITGGTMERASGQGAVLPAARALFTRTVQPFTHRLGSLAA